MLYTYIHICEHACAHLYVCMCICIYIYTYVRVCIYLYIYRLQRLFHLWASLRIGSVSSLCIKQKCVHPYRIIRSACTYVYICIHCCIYEYKCTYICIYIYTRGMCICAIYCMYVCIDTMVHIRIYIYTCICMHIYIYAPCIYTCKSWIGLMLKHGDCFHAIYTSTYVISAAVWCIHIRICMYMHVLYIYIYANMPDKCTYPFYHKLLSKVV